ncbi:MAG: hypothetical protein IJ906_04595 [Oscillospiraceae bacterium]|nr:hypothetical protein [Oscillospiraceae bacterium]
MTYIRAMQDFPVTFGTLTLHLQEYQITGGCLLREQGTAAGDAAVAAVYPKGTRIAVKGKLAPPAAEFAAVGAALDATVRSGITRTVYLGDLRCQGMRLIGYTLGLRDITAEVTLVFYTQTPLDTEEEEDAS